MMFLIWCLYYFTVVPGIRFVRAAAGNKQKSAIEPLTYGLVLRR